MKILITGGNGYIGAYLAEYLREHDFDVYITSRKNGTDAKCRRLELLDVETCTGICHGMDAIVHLANLDERLVKENGRDALLANAYATREIYRDAAKAGVKKFIYFSTFHVYGCDSGNIDETATPKPKADYGLTHYFAEQYLEQLSNQKGLPVAAIRLTNGIGAPQGTDKWYLALNDFCRTVFKTGKIVLKSNGLPQRDFVPIRDVAEAVAILLESGQQAPYEVYNVSYEMTYSIRALAMAAAECYEQRYGKKASLEIPHATQEERNAVQPLKVSSQKIRSLGWTPRLTLNEVIEEIFSVLEKGENHGHDF